MNEERRMILEMLQEGAVSVEEAERLLAALSQEADAPSGRLPAVADASPAGPAPKRVVVLVTEGGKPKVNVRIPFSLVRVGLKLGKSFSSVGMKGARDDPQAREALEILQNLDIDELLAGITGGDITLPYALVDVEDEEKGELVRVVLE